MNNKEKLEKKLKEIEIENKSKYMAMNMLLDTMILSGMKEAMILKKIYNISCKLRNNKILIELIMVYDNELINEVLKRLDEIENQVDNLTNFINSKGEN